VRQNFDNLKSLRKEALAFFNLKENVPVVLVLGGSGGAGSINESLSENLQAVIDSGCQWIWQTGKYYFEDVNALVSIISPRNIKVHGFIDRMDYAFAAADVIITRAGAGTISELCLVGKPVVLIPSPNVTEDHQTKNAMALSERSAAILIPDDKALKNMVKEAVSLISDKEKRDILSENILKMADREADKRIAEEVMKLIRQ
jgi:UDP-N-acetylglucosamine--N-acetylmuramyl-(pentapeptide) pyrophosphoryl-undecaprenol N-acetylglucosamine transferase